MNILAIRGGGTRGVIVTRFLIEIEKFTGKRTYELFDYIGGSSVGCLIATGMLMSDEEGKPKHTAQDMHNILLENMNETFSWTYSSWIASGFGLFGSSYTNIGLLNIINSMCGDIKMNNLLRPIIFPAYDRISHKAYYFERDKDKDLLLKDVIMSCTAAPTYFPSHKMEIKGKTYDMVDGGIVVNNTVELAFLSATKNMTCIDKSKILELNIGTGAFENNIADSHGLLTWMPAIVNTLMHACNENGLYELSLSLPPENYRIFDVPLDAKYFSVDDIKSTKFYIGETDKWILNNKMFIMEFCYKLMANKGYDVTEICKKINEEIENSKLLLISDQKSNDQPSNDQPLEEPLNEQLLVEPPNDKPLMEPSNDKPLMEPSNDKPLEESSNKQILGEPSNEQILGEPSNEQILGEPSNEQILGEPSNEKSFDELLSELDNALSLPGVKSLDVEPKCYPLDSILKELPNGKSLGIIPSGKPPGNPEGKELPNIEFLDMGPLDNVNNSLADPLYHSFDKPLTGSINDIVYEEFFNDLQKKVPRLIPSNKSNSTIITTNDFYNPHDTFIYDENVFDTVDNYYNMGIRELKLKVNEC
jgi:hypothetical protein